MLEAILLPLQSKLLKSMNIGSSGSSRLFKELNEYKMEVSECSAFSGLEQIVIITCYMHFSMSILFYWHCIGI